MSNKKNARKAVAQAARILGESDLPYAANKALQLYFSLGLELAYEWAKTVADDDISFYLDVINAEA